MMVSDYNRIRLFSGRTALGYNRQTRRKQHPADCL
nr:MAG TPA: hypothetical protein [Bacteriophage sp.]